MTTITRERLEQIIACPASAWSSDVIRELARIALASLEAEPVLYAAEETLAYAKHGELHLTCLSEPMGDAVIPLYTTPPAPVVPDRSMFETWWESQNGSPFDSWDSLRTTDGYCDDGIDGQFEAWNACRAAMLQGANDSLTHEGKNHSEDKLGMVNHLGDANEKGNSPVIPDANGWLPCPFCNSPVKWCGENSADPEDDHACHHIQCTNPECGADFDFTNTGDDLLPDDPAILDAMTAAECLQPLRNVCLNRFNSRAAMLHGSQAVSNRDELLPSITHAPELDSVAKNAKLLPSKYPVIPDEVLSAIRKVARIRTDFDHFDGDRRGIANCLDEAEQELIVTINEHAAMLQAGNGSTNGKLLTITLPALPVLGSQEEWYQGFAAGAGSMREECAAALISAGIRVEMK